MQTCRLPLDRRAAALVVVILALAPGCSDSTQGGAARAPTPAAGTLEPWEPFGRTTVTLRAPGGGDSLEVPVYDAFAPETRRRGLMHRKELPAQAGMVFRFPAERDGGFWMKNTLIPLSIAYFDDAGEIVAVMDMEPCTADPCPSYDPGLGYRGALEVNRGFFDDAGVTPGWSVELPAGLPPAR